MNKQYIHPFLLDDVITSIVFAIIFDFDDPLHLFIRLHDNKTIYSDVE